MNIDAFVTMWHKGKLLKINKIEWKPIYVKNEYKMTSRFDAWTKKERVTHTIVMSLVNS